MKNKILSLWSLFSEILRLPVARLCFSLELNPLDVRRTHKNFTKPHPTYKLFRNKSLGVALIALDGFASSKDYLESINGKNSAAYYARKARARGYRLAEIERNDFVDDIHEINTSAELRQGRAMAPAYLEKTTHYDSEANYRYYGVLDAEGKLLAYCNLGLYGNFVLVSQLLGHKNALNDGVMYLMLADIVSAVIEEFRFTYVMYDTFFGAQAGLKLFKVKLGFQSYRVKYSIQ
ncbi:hypothetical protein [Janthinobacterium sp.]|uniref:hypothetical protein n=1 Tax=Janthinobacterium sp. TaxID=1871054 RepID=UPI00293D8880|nr:hypothetical protein [Janthinobacterium sp.]